MPDDAIRPASRTTHSFPPEVIARVHEMADTGQYPIRGLGARRKLPTFDDLVFLTASVSPLPAWRATGSAARPRPCSAAATAPSRLELDIPITIAGMSFGALSAAAKEALGRAATEVGHVDHHGRRRHDPRGAQGLRAARVPGAAVALRLRPRRPPPGRRRRDRHRPGGQAGRRRPAARPEGQRAGGRHAHPARRASTSARPAATPTGSVPTTCASRSRSSARPPTGPSRST